MSLLALFPLTGYFAGSVFSLSFFCAPFEKVSSGLYEDIYLKPNPKKEKGVEKREREEKPFLFLTERRGQTEEEEGEELGEEQEEKKRGMS